jgi:hypothetical protein
MALTVNIANRGARNLTSRFLSRSLSRFAPRFARHLLRRLAKKLLRDPVPTKFWQLAKRVALGGTAQVGKAAQCCHKPRNFRSWEVSLGRMVVAEQNTQLQLRKEQRIARPPLIPHGRLTEGPMGAPFQHAIGRRGRPKFARNCVTTIIREIVGLELALM